MKTHVLPSLTLLFIAALISGCGGSDTKIVEREPIPIEDEHDDHDDHSDEVNLGRLLISTKDQAKVSVIDINEKSVLHEVTVSESPSALYASPNSRYGFVVERTADRVDVIDGGLWQEDHGDHLHDYEEDPVQMLFSTNKARPTHFTGTENQSVIFLAVVARQQHLQVLAYLLKRISPTIPQEPFWNTPPICTVLHKGGVSI